MRQTWIDDEYHEAVKRYIREMNPDATIAGEVRKALRKHLSTLNSEMIAAGKRPLIEESGVEDD